MNILQYLDTKHVIPMEKCDVETGDFCSLCFRKISGPHYSGTSLSHKPIWLHESCAESPAKIEHPLHPPHSLRIHFDDSGFTSFLCNECFTFTAALKYSCETCKFNLDFPCVNSNPLEFKPKQKVERLIPNHPHKLLRFYFTVRQPLLQNLTCCCCLKDIKDSGGYACLKCKFLIHESCLATLPRQVKSSFHPQHPLFLYSIGKIRSQACKACGIKICGVALRCEICDCWFHVSCGEYTRAGLRINEEFTVFYLDEGFETNRECCCGVCNESILKGPIYKDVEAGVSVHVECILPCVLDHECHHHQLLLTGSVVPRDDFEYYHCDVCEEKKVFNRYVYHCEECYFMTHIECLVTTTWEVIYWI